MPPRKKQISLALRGRTGTIRPDRIATTGPLSEPTIPVSPQAAGPAVPEREIGPGGVSGCSAMPGSEKVQPARQSSRIQGSGGHCRTPRRPRCRHGEDRPMGAGKPGLQRPRHDRRFPPPGVKDVASYGWTTYKRGVAHGGGARGGASLQQPQRSTLRGRSPRRRGRGCSRESALDVGWHGFPESSAVKRSAVLRRGVPASHGVSWRRTGGGGSGGSDPLFFAAGAAQGRGRWCTPKSTTFPPLFGGHSLHSDPWREGHRALPRSGPINRSVLPLDTRRPGSRPSHP